MAGFIAKAISKKILGETAANRFGKEDFWFESVPATRLDGKPNGKTKQKLKDFKAIVPGVSHEDMRVLTKVKRRAYRLDMSLFNCCGIRFGWSSVIGIVPGVGDVLDCFMAMMVVYTCKQVKGGLPSTVLSQMYMNVILDFVVGLVPFLGDIADAVFRANTRNAIVLEEYLRKEGLKNLRQSGRPVPAVDPSDPDQFDHVVSDAPRTRTVKSQPGRNDNMTADQHGHDGLSSGVTEPANARVRDDRDDRQSGGGGFFGFGSKKTRPADEETGRHNQGKVRKPNGRG